MCCVKKYQRYTGEATRVALSSSPTLYIMVRSNVEIPRIEQLCFLELDSQNW